jgi:hypothetical protein
MEWLKNKIARFKARRLLIRDVREVEGERDALRVELATLRLRIEDVRREESARADREISAAEERLKEQRDQIQEKLDLANEHRRAVTEMELALYGQVETVKNRLKKPADDIENEIAALLMSAKRIQGIRSELGKIENGTIFQNYQENLLLENQSDGKESGISGAKSGDRKSKNTGQSKRKQTD